VTKGTLRILTYTKMQYLGLFIASFLNSGFNILYTVAFQNERTAFVMLVAYISVIFAFIGDVLIFKTSFGVFEIVGAVIVTICTCSIIVKSLRKDSK
jgi:drug/metabolite transporter (DMT)-like permease